MNNLKKIKFEYVRIALYIISIIAVIFVVNGTINTNCHWYEKYGFLCPTCGLTRATKYIFLLDFKNAIKYNFFYSSILFPFVTILVFNDIYVLVKRHFFKKKELSFIEILLGEAKKNERDKDNSNS